MAVLSPCMSLLTMQASSPAVALEQCLEPVLASVQLLLLAHRSMSLGSASFAHLWLFPL